MSAHGTPEQIRKNLSHPVIDGDGHWIEYTPVFAEKMRKVVGDKGADGFIASQRRIPDNLRPCLVGFPESHGVGMARSAAASQRFVRQLRDVGSAHHEIGRAHV